MRGSFAASVVRKARRPKPCTNCAAQVLSTVVQLCKLRKLAVLSGPGGDCLRAVHQLRRVEPLHEQRARIHREAQRDRIGEHGADRRAAARVVEDAVDARREPVCAEAPELARARRVRGARLRSGQRGPRNLHAVAADAAGPRAAGSAAPAARRGAARATGRLAAAAAFAHGRARAARALGAARSDARTAASAASGTGSARLSPEPRGFARRAADRERERETAATKTKRVRQAQHGFFSGPGRSSQEQSRAGDDHRKLQHGAGSSIRWVRTRPQVFLCANTYSGAAQHPGKNVPAPARKSTREGAQRYDRLAPE